MNLLNNPKQYALLFACFILGISVLVGFQYVGNMFDDKGTKKIHKAFERNNLTGNPYNGRKLSYQTPEALLGIDIYPDCQVYLSIIVPKERSIKEALIPPMGRVKDARNPCESLERIVSDKESPTLGKMKTRYWWGSKAFTSLSLNFLSLFHTIQLLKIVTLFMYFIIAFLLLKISSNLFYTFLPIIIYGFFFSANMYFGGIALALPYTWSLLCIAVLLFLMLKDSCDSTYKVFFILSGIGSSYIFLLDGHIVFLMPVYILVIYFLISAQCNEGRKYKNIALFLMLYIIGLFGGIICDQLLSMIYLNADNVSSGFSKQLALRLSSSYPEYITANNPDFNIVDIFKRLFIYYGRTGAYGSNHIFWGLLSGGGAFIFALIISAWLSIRRNNLNALYRQIPFLLAITIFFLRFLLLKNHSAVHVQFLSRYMFVPLAFGWSMLFLAFFEWNNRKLVHTEK